MKIMFFISSLPEDELTKRQFPLGVGYIAAYLEQHLPSVQIKITADINEVLEEKPDLLGISSVSQCFNYAVSGARLVKEALGIPIVLGGYHVSTLPHKLSSCFDVGVIGEGERTFLALVKLFLEKKKFISRDLAHINGICFHDGSGAVRINAPESLIEPLDILPFPKRNISRGARNIFLFSSRGCVYRCKFCASTRHWLKFRSHSAEYFVRELRHLRKTYDAESIHLLDDLFFADRKRVRKIVELMEQQGLLGQFSFDCFISSNLATRETLILAKKLGFKAIRFGGETGSDRLLKDMKGSQASVAHHQNCIDLCQELGLDVRASFMLGSPGETEEDLEKTYQFLKKNRGRLKIHGFYLTTPVPGTPYWDLALEKGLVSEDMDWDRLNLDYLKGETFALENAIYMNEENVPLEKLKWYFQKFKEEFEFHVA